MKRLSIFALTLVLASPLAAQWTEGGANIGANLDTLAVNLQGFGTNVFGLVDFGTPYLYLVDTTGYGIGMWGDYGPDGSRLYMGGATPIIFRTYTSSFDKVAIPQDAIQSYEISNEAGVVSALEGLSSTTLSGSGWDTLLLQTIVAPDTGFLLILGTAQVNVSHSNGSTSGAHFGVFVDGNAPNTQDEELSLPSSAATGTYKFPVTVQTIVPVGAGSHDVTFEGNQLSSSGTFTLWDMQLSVVYLPTAYGTVAKVSTTHIPEDQAPRRVTSVPAHQIRAESEAANQARIQAELQKIRQRLAELEAEMKAHGTR